MSRTNHLRLISPSGGDDLVTAGQATTTPPLQMALFSGAPSLIAVVDCSTLYGSRLCLFVDQLQPRLVLDLRTAPQFDVGAYGRRYLFRQWSEMNAPYIDIPRFLCVESRFDARLNPAFVARVVAQEVERHVGLRVSRAGVKRSKILRGNVLLFSDERGYATSVVEAVADALNANVSGLFVFDAGVTAE